MSILIKGMEMPKNCGACPFCVPEADEDRGDICVLCGQFPLAKDEKSCECPLVPVPPHGRLIDADALAEHKFVCVPHVIVNDKEAGVAYRLGWNTAIEAIMENAETVIGGE